jgi:hypothetical protein
VDFNLRRRREEEWVDQSPEGREGRWCRKDFDLARVDGMAGVRKGRKNMEDVIEREEERGG